MPLAATDSFYVNIFEPVVICTNINLKSDYFRHLFLLFDVSPMLRQQQS
jgi:hypothetical protein